MARVLVLPCKILPDDHLTYSWDEDAGQGELRVTTRYGVNNYENFFTVEQARELFNWLGVMLHTGGR